MPFTVFVDLFALARNRVRTPTLFTFWNVEDRTFSDIMDEGWATRTTDTGDVIWCTIVLASVVFRYHIARQTLYVNFYYTRQHQVGAEWIVMEHECGVQMEDIVYEILSANLPLSLTFTVGTCWPVEHLRGEVQIAMGQSAPLEFSFYVSEPPPLSETRKINR